MSMTAQQRKANGQVFAGAKKNTLHFASYRASDHAPNRGKPGFGPLQCKSQAQICGKYVFVIRLYPEFVYLPNARLPLTHETDFWTDWGLA